MDSPHQVLVYLLTFVRWLKGINFPLVCALPRGIVFGRHLCSCNLTVLQEPGQEDLAEFLAKHKVRLNQIP